MAPTAFLTWKQTARMAPNPLAGGFCESPTRMPFTKVEGSASPKPPHRHPGSGMINKPNPWGEPGEAHGSVRSRPTSATLPRDHLVKRNVHQLKVTLRSVRPPVWRRIVVKPDTTLGELAPILEAAMGWLGTHLHLLDVDGTWYGARDPEWARDVLDENRFRLGGVLPAVGSKMRWDYDFGDGWEHDVLVEAISPSERGVEYPVCLAGRRACPPEDCGGPWGYADLLKALADPAHPDHQQLREWAPPDFDPARFDLEETNLAIRSFCLE